MPDLILLDLVMPEKSGDKIVKALKENAETKMIPIIMVSGNGEMVYLKKKDQFKWRPNSPIVRNRGDIVKGKDPQALAEAYGVDQYISKPFSTDVLMKMIRDVLRKSKKIKIEKGRWAKFDYKLKLDGRIIASSDEKIPLIIRPGMESTIPDIEVELEGLNVGDEKTIIIEPKDAYRLIDPQAFREASKTSALDMGKPRVGIFELVIKILEIE